MQRSGQRGLVHQALLYDTSDEFLAAAVPFINEGLEQGDAVLAITTKSDTALLRSSLGAAADSVAFLEPTTWYDAPGRALASCYRYLDECLGGRDFLRIIGQPVWAGLDPLETAEWGRYEAVVNVALASSPAWMMCGYDSASLPAEIVADVRRTHPELAVGGSRQRSETFADPALYYAECNREFPPPPAQGVQRMAFDLDPAPVRRFIGRHAPTFGLAAHRVEEFKLAVNEVTTNAIRHGGGHGNVLLWRSGQRLVCEVSDDGTVQDSFLGHMPGDPTAERGHGLWICRQLCDLLEIRTNQPGTRVRLHMRCH